MRAEGLGVGVRKDDGLSYGDSYAVDGWVMTVAGGWLSRSL